MAQIFQKIAESLGKKHKLELASESWEKPLGEFCSFCQTRLH